MFRKCFVIQRESDTLPSGLDPATKMVTNAANIVAAATKISMAVRQL